MDELIGYFWQYYEFHKETFVASSYSSIVANVISISQALIIIILGVFLFLKREKYDPSVVIVSTTIAMSYALSSSTDWFILSIMREYDILVVEITQGWILLDVLVVVCAIVAHSLLNVRPTPRAKVILYLLMSNSCFYAVTNLLYTYEYYWLQPPEGYPSETFLNPILFIYTYWNWGVTFGIVYLSLTSKKVHTENKT